MDTKLIDFIYRIERSDSVDAAWYAWVEFVRSLGASHTVYGYFPITETSLSNQLPLLSSMPQDWMEYYYHQNYMTIDHTIPHCQTRTDPVDAGLDLLDGLKEVDKETETFLQELSETGVRSGRSFPLRERKIGGWGGVSFLSDLRGPEFRRQMEDIERLITVAANFLHDHLQQLLRKEAADGFQLSPRERECLMLMADYHTVQQIADRLTLKEGTVHEYLESARRKLGVATTTHAVAKALRCELLRD